MILHNGGPSISSSPAASSLTVVIPDDLQPCVGRVGRRELPKSEDVHIGYPPVPLQGVEPRNRLRTVKDMLITESRLEDAGALPVTYP